MDVDYIAQIIDDIEGSMIMDEKSYLYTLKIVMAENLVALDSNGLSDMYCVISDEGDKMLVQMHIIYETLNPWWDEAFDITIDSDLVKQKW